MSRTKRGRFPIRIDVSAQVVIAAGRRRWDAVTFDTEPITGCGQSISQADIKIHQPMVAFVIPAGTMIAGETALGVRLFDLLALPRVGRCIRPMGIFCLAEGEWRRLRRSM